MGGRALPKRHSTMSPRTSSIPTLSHVQPSRNTRRRNHQAQRIRHHFGTAQARHRRQQQYRKTLPHRQAAGLTPPTRSTLRAGRTNSLQPAPAHIVERTPRTTAGTSKKWNSGLHPRLRLKAPILITGGSPSDLALHPAAAQPQKTQSSPPSIRHLAAQ